MRYGYPLRRSCRCSPRVVLQRRTVACGNWSNSAFRSRSGPCRRRAVDQEPRPLRSVGYRTEYAASTKYPTRPTGVTPIAMELKPSVRSIYWTVGTRQDRAGPTMRSRRSSSQRRSQVQHLHGTADRDRSPRTCFGVRSGLFHGEGVLLHDLVGQQLLAGLVHLGFGGLLVGGLHM